MPHLKTNLSRPTRFVRGAAYPGLSFPRQEGIQFGAGPDGLTFLFLHDRPTAREIQGARSGTMEMALLPYGRHTTFVLLRLEPTFKGWTDAPFCLGKLPVGRRGLPLREPHQGFSIMTHLVDARSGTIHSNRMLSLSPRFSAALEECVEIQRANLRTYSPEAHTTEYLEAYKTHWSSAGMARSALVAERAGVPFDQAPISLNDNFG